MNREPTIGDKVRCRITGFTGIITSHASYIAGCDRFWVEPSVGADNKKGDGMWVDIDMAEVIEPQAVERVVYTRRAPGGIDLPRPY